MLHAISSLAPIVHSCRPSKAQPPNGHSWPERSQIEVVVAIRAIAGSTSIVEIESGQLQGDFDQNDGIHDGHT